MAFCLNFLWKYSYTVYSIKPSSLVCLLKTMHWKAWKIHHFHHAFRHHFVSHEGHQGVQIRFWISQLVCSLHYIIHTESEGFSMVVLDKFLQICTVLKCIMCIESTAKTENSTIIHQSKILVHVDWEHSSLLLSRGSNSKSELKSCTSVYVWLLFTSILLFKLRQWQNWWSFSWNDLSCLLLWQIFYKNINTKLQVTKTTYLALLRIVDR